uniref:Polycystic kidney disease 1 like 2a n=1 Tax=Amphiprion percula TaxID=161767 RepID=A0A3P8SK35_AMPPE
GSFKRAGSLWLSSLKTTGSFGSQVVPQIFCCLHEFVGLQRSFFSAQAWCEVSGGHLAFIPDEDTQDFLQTHLDSEKDMWLGVAPSSSTNQQYSVTDEGKWSKMWPTNNSLTLKLSFQATRDCNKKLHFICQFGMYSDSSSEQRRKLNHSMMNYLFALLLYSPQSLGGLLCVRVAATLCSAVLQWSQDIFSNAFQSQFSIHSLSICVSDTEERYTWLLSPESLKGHTGTHYLVVRPIVGPGIKSINASLSITSITASCKYWNESLSAWYDHGCRVGVNTTHSATQCLCNHLTFFGSSFFVTPNLVDPSRTAELFATFAENPVVVCFVGALFVTYLLVVVWARRKDIQDTAKVKVTVLADNDPMDEYRYLLSVCTGHRVGASTSSQVTVTLLGAEGNSEPHHLTDPKKPVFERGGVDMFLITAPFCLGDLQSLRLWHNNSGSHPSWYVGNVIVQDFQTEQKWHFLCNSWLAIDMEDCCLDKVFPASTEEDLKRFSNLFFMKTTKDFSDGHLWFSVVNRPVSSTFTCVQRVSCCFSLLLCTMLTSIMFYGIPTDPSEQTMDLGTPHFHYNSIYSYEQVQSSLIMFPVNILIVSIFRNTRPREMSCCRRQTKKPEALEQDSSTQTLSSHAATPNMNHLPYFFKTVTNQLYTENLCTFSESSASVHPAQTEKGIQKKSNKIQYLYRQLCHIELSLQSLSSFPSPHSYSQALQQVQALKSVLEEQLFTSNSNKRVCCQGMLPWWFIFVGWLLVIGTSVVSGYFTMLYGLNFGKERSISWLVSMIVSFFQSLLLIQPLKVGQCTFVSDLNNLTNDPPKCLTSLLLMLLTAGDCKDQQMTRRDAGLYVPPPPADIEKMRRNRILEQKAFALLREILIYMGFLWMLLLVAYGQRDPNAFLLNKHIRKSFSAGISSSMSVGDVFAWANKSLLRNLYGVYPGQVHCRSTVDSLLQYLIAFLVLLTTVKMWHLLRLNPKMNMITATLQRAWSDISDFLVVIVIISVSSRFFHSLFSDVVLNYSPVLGGFLIGSCIVFMSFVVLNLLVSVILVAFNQEQIYHKEESVDLLLKKICSLFGIRYEDTNDSPGPDVNGSSGLTLNNSRNIHNTPSVDVNIFQTSDNKVNPEGHSLI